MIIAYLPLIILDLRIEATAKILKGEPNTNFLIHTILVIFEPDHLLEFNYASCWLMGSFECQNIVLNEIVVDDFVCFFGEFGPGFASEATEFGHSVSIILNVIY